MEYFWYYRPEEDFPPPPVNTPDQAGDAERLNVAYTQTDLTPARQRALVRQWCDVLPTLTHVRFLWLNSRVPQALFDAACSMPALEGLYVKWSGIQDADALRDARALRYFHLGSSTALESIEPVGDCAGLEWLGLENLKRIDTIEPLARLTDLVGLYLEGSMWSTQRVATLAPVGRLAKLRYLSIANLRTADGTLRPLFALRNLETFRAARWWDPAEVAELRRLNPRLATED